MTDKEKRDINKWALTIEEKIDLLRQENKQIKEIIEKIKTQLSGIPHVKKM